MNSLHRAASLGAPRSLPRHRRTRAATTRAIVYEAQAPDASMLWTLGATGLLGTYWWNVTVPEARARLSKDKRKGSTRAFLDDIADDESKSLQRWFYSNWLEAKWFKAARAKRLAAAASAAAAAPASEPEAALAVSEEPDAVPADKEPEFWSLDNPLVLSLAVLAGFAALATLQHSLSS